MRFGLFRSLSTVMAFLADVLLGPALMKLTTLLSSSREKTANA